MRMPDYAKPVPRTEALFALADDGASSVTPQGCSAWDWVKCVGKIAGCLALPTPAMIACVAANAPDCLRCVQ